MSAAASQSAMERIGATPGKLALIAILAVILAYVVISQFSGSSPDVPQARAPMRNSRGRVAIAPKPDAAAKQPRRNIKPWPKPDIDRVVVYDPFAPRQWKSPENIATSEGGGEQQEGVASPPETPLARLMSSGTTAVIIVNGERLALVGDKQVRVGDRLEGFKVTEITESGIVLATEEDSP